MTDPWKETALQIILTNYTKTDIYNADEFGLFFKVLPKNTLHLKDEKCTGGKHSKIRVTGLAAANKNGDKLPMFVIGKSQKPRSFKNIQKLPCRYRGQKSCITLSYTSLYFLRILFVVAVVVVYHKICFYHFHSFLLMKYQISTTEY